MESSASSLMVVLENEEYCYLYDRPSFPDLLEALLDHRQRAGDSGGQGLDIDQAHEIARRLIHRTYQEI